jgi:hypothetical protein
MSGEFEAAGALATAGLVAGAIEGREGGEAGEGACLNCGAKLEGRFCSQCGQTAHPHRSLGHVFEEFMHGVIHFDTKAWRTLPMVIFRPGTLTRNYVFGKRARYISPLALFLFTIFTMFFAFAFIQTPGLDGAPETQRVEAVQALEEARTELAQAERELAAAIAAPAPTDGSPVGLEARLARQAVSLAEAEVARRERTLEIIDEVTAEARASDGADAIVTVDGVIEAPAAAPAPAPTQEAAPEATEEAENNVGWGPGETWQDGVARAARAGRFVAIAGMPELNKHINKKLENPDLALYKVQQTAYKFSFLLVPLSLPFIALLFLWKRGVTFYDHVVYALYALSFASLLFVTVILTSLSPMTSWVIGWLIGIGLPAHAFFHLKGAYKLGWWSALWRALFMLFFALIVLTFFLIAIFLLGLGAG